MLPDDQSDEQLKKYRARELLLGALLAFCALGSSAVYLTTLRSMNRVLLIGLIAVEWLVMLVVYLIIVSKMRRRRR